MNKCLKVGIVGAGIQGISNALFLQKKGFEVTIFDRENPGSPAASYGNAGHFSPYASLSLNRTDILLDVPAMLMSSTGPLALKWNYVPKMIPWFMKFIMNTSKNKILMDAMYGDSIYVDDRTIDSHIKRLRKKFKIFDSTFDQIRTRYGSGYSWRE